MVTVKSIFYKFCFCLGLGTASYYTFAQVQNWVKGDDAPQASVFEDKVHDLTKDERLALGKHHAHHLKREIKALPVAVIAPVASPAAAAVAEASPSPADGEKKDGEKKEGEENKTAENAEGTQNPDMVAQPIPQAYLLNNQQMNQPWDQSRSDSANANSNSSNPDYSNAGGFYYGNPNPNHGGGYSGSGGSSSSVNNSILNQEDIAILTTSPVQAAFANQQNQVSGYVCSSASSCTHQSGLSVHSLRWSYEEGLRPDVNFEVKPASGSNAVQFDVSFKVQDRLLNDQVVTMSARPSDVLVRNETRDSKSYRVYEFRMPDTDVRSDDTLTQMQATLVYEVTETGMVMSPESKFSFARDQIKTSSDAWNPNGSGDVTQNELYFVADELPYSMSLQKSP